jgi:hypothetical protein
VLAFFSLYISSTLVFFVFACVKYYFVNLRLWSLVKKENDQNVYITNIKYEFV